MSLTWYEHGPKLKKWFVSEQAILEHEAQDLKASDILWQVDDNRSWPLLPHLGECYRHDTKFKMHGVATAVPIDPLPLLSPTSSHHMPLH